MMNTFSILIFRIPSLFSSSTSPDVCQPDLFPWIYVCRQNTELCWHVLWLMVYSISYKENKWSQGSLNERNDSKELWSALYIFLLLENIEDDERTKLFDEKQQFFRGDKVTDHFFCWRLIISTNKKLVLSQWVDS